MGGWDDLRWVGGIVGLAVLLLGAEGTGDGREATAVPSIEEARQSTKSKYVAYLRRRLTALPEKRIGKDFPCHPDDWRRHAAQVRRALRQVFDFPPAPGPLNARVVEREELGDVVVEKALYDSEPFNTVTANLYLPKAVC